MTFLRLCFAGALAAVSFSSAQADSFIKGSDVVILVGLPGDMESEKNYGNETQRFLQLLEQPELAPRSVLLLSSLSPPTGVKPPYPLELKPNDRATFLGSARQAKTGARSVFVVFGHGGSEESIPVFHVPGPRLTPEDFVSVAAGASTSTWLLFFPGSGNFAKALQARDRTLLATETDDKVFQQDPISFGLFLTALEKEGDLGRLGARWGAATRTWYENRHLARTEEPALWIGTQPPVKLAQSGASANDTPEADSSITPNRESIVPPKAPLVTASDSAWSTIVPVDPAKYSPNAAVTLSRKIAYILDDNSGVTKDEDSFLQILTPEGKRYGDFQISFSPPDEDLNFLACEVRLPNGKIESLDPDEIRDAASSAAGEDDPTKNKLLSFPHIEPGAIIHLHLQREWHRFPMPHVFQEIPLVSENPTVALQIEVRLPEKEAFHFKLLHQPAVDPLIAKTDYGSVYTWEFHDLPAVVTEPLSPPEQTPALVVTTFPDWTNFSAWYIRLIRESDHAEPELTTQANDLIAGAKDDQEKIERITRFVTNFRYVSVPLGVNSFRPHSALHVWQNRYGDCKDKANLLDTLLTAVGFRTHLVLVPRFSQAYEDLPGFAFNHAIAQVQMADKTLWIDSTDDVCRFGLLPPGDAGRQVLVIDDKVRTLTLLPGSNARDHRLTIDTTVEMGAAAGHDAKVDIQADGIGYADYLLRASAQAAGTHPVLPLLSGPFSPISGMFLPENQQATAVDDLAQNFTWKSHGFWDGLVSRLPESSVELLRLPAWIAQEWRVAALPRSNPLHLNQGYPMEIVQTWHIHLPPGSSNVKLPGPQSDAGPPLSWSLTWDNRAPSEITARLGMTLAAADLGQKETGDFRTSCQHLLEALEDGLTFQKP